MNAIGSLLAVLLSGTEFGTQANPLPLRYTKRRIGTYPTIYIGPKSAERIPQQLLAAGDQTAIDRILHPDERAAWV